LFKAKEIFKIENKAFKYLSPVPPSKWDSWFGGSRWWHLCRL